MRHILLLGLRGLTALVPLAVTLLTGVEVFGLAPVPRIAATWEDWKKDPDAPRPGSPFTKERLDTIRVEFDDEKKIIDVKAESVEKLSDSEQQVLREFWPKWVDYAIKNIPEMNAYITDLKNVDGLRFEREVRGKEDEDRCRKHVQSKPSVNPSTKPVGVGLTNTCEGGYSYLLAGRRWRCCRSVCVIPLVNAPTLQSPCWTIASTNIADPRVIAAASLVQPTATRVARIPTAKNVVFADTSLLLDGQSSGIGVALTSASIAKPTVPSDVSLMVAKEIAADARRKLLDGDLSSAAVLAEDAVRQDRSNVLAWAVRAICALRSGNAEVADASIQVVADAIASGVTDRKALFRQFEKVQGADRVKFERELLKALLRSPVKPDGSTVAASH